MNREIRVLDVVALTEDISDRGLLRGQLEIEHDDQVERRVERAPPEQVGLDPLDLHPALRRQPTRLVERHAGEVDARDPPAAKGKPDGVPAGTAGDVERTARLEVSDLVDEKAVRLGPEEQTPLAVLTVPVLALHACILVTE